MARPLTKHHFFDRGRHNFFLLRVEFLGIDGVTRRVGRIAQFIVPDSLAITIASCCRPICLRLVVTLGVVHELVLVKTTATRIVVALTVEVIVQVIEYNSLDLPRTELLLKCAHSFEKHFVAYAHIVTRSEEYVEEIFFFRL